MNEITFLVAILENDSVNFDSNQLGSSTIVDDVFSQQSTPTPSPPSSNPSTINNISLGSSESPPPGSCQASSLLPALPPPSSSPYSGDHNQLESHHSDNHQNNLDFEIARHHGDDDDDEDNKDNMVILDLEKFNLYSTETSHHHQTTDDNISYTLNINNNGNHSESLTSPVSSCDFPLDEKPLPFYHLDCLAPNFMGRCATSLASVLSSSIAGSLNSSSSFNTSPTSTCYTTASINYPGSNDLSRYHPSSSRCYSLANCDASSSLPSRCLGQSSSGLYGPGSPTPNGCLIGGFPGFGSLSFGPYPNLGAAAAAAACSSTSVEGFGIISSCNSNGLGSPLNGTYDGNLFSPFGSLTSSMCGSLGRSEGFNVTNLINTGQHSGNNGNGSNNSNNNDHNNNSNNGNNPNNGSNTINSNNASDSGGVQCNSSGHEGPGYSSSDEPNPSDELSSPNYEIVRGDEDNVIFVSNDIETREEIIGDTVGLELFAQEVKALEDGRYDCRDRRDLEGLHSNALGHHSLLGGPSLGHGSSLLAIGAGSLASGALLGPGDLSSFGLLGGPGSLVGSSQLNCLGSMGSIGSHLNGLNSNNNNGNGNGLVSSSTPSGSGLQQGKQVKSRRKKKDQVEYVILDVNSAGDEKTEFIKYVGKGSYKCQICDIYSKNNKDYIQDHINIKHYNIKKNYECLLCNITFAWRSGAFKHLKKYHSIEGKNTILYFRAISKRHVYHSQRKRK